jgi:hypothetical protein
MFKVLVIVICCLLPFISIAQNQFYQDIFTEIANSFGESKPAPKLEILGKDLRCKIPAQYLPDRTMPD